MSLDKLRAFIRLTRPVFLLGGALMYGLGIALAVRQGAAIHIGHALLGQWMVTATQLTAQYTNEYYDLDCDRQIGEARTRFSGGSGVLAVGDLPHAVALIAARISAVGALIAILIAATIQPTVGLIGLIALAGGWFYSAPPALMGSGWGELTASLIVALLAPLTGFMLQTGRADPLLFLLCLPLVLIHWAMIIAFEFPDYEADKAVGKHTLTVRLGRNRAALLHNVLLSAAAIPTCFLVLNREEARFLGLAALLALHQVVGVWNRSRHGWTRFQQLTLGAVALFSLSAGLLLAGIIL